jgi:drug/metabolite transporter (DMT)-like permease
LSSPSSPAANRRGILAMLTAMTLYTGNDTFLKIATADFPPGQIMAVRGIFAIVLAVGLVVAMGELQHWRKLASTRVLLRALVDSALAFVFITALTHLPLANITAILQATPMMLTLIVALLGIEQVGWRRWSAIIVGFIGVLLIVRPSIEGFNVYAWISLLAALLIAIRDLITRSIKTQVPTIIVTLSSTLAITIVGFGLSVTETWQPVATLDLAILCAAAVFVTLGNIAIVIAFRVGEVSVVSPFRYAVILTSLVAGLLFFEEWPDLIACAGIALIVLSGLYMLHREQARQRATLEPLESKPVSSKAVS